MNLSTDLGWGEKVVYSIWLFYFLSSFFSTEVVLSGMLDIGKFISLAVGLCALISLLLIRQLRKFSQFTLPRGAMFKILTTSYFFSLTCGIFLSVIHLDQFFSIHNANEQQVVITVKRVMCSTTSGTKISSLKSAQSYKGKYCFSEQTSSVSAPFRQWDVPSLIVPKTVGINSDAKIKLLRYRSTLFGFNAYTIVLTVM